MGHRQDFQTLNVQLFLKKEIRRPDSFVWEGQSPFSKKAGAPVQPSKLQLTRCLGIFPENRGSCDLKNKKEREVKNDGKISL